MKTHKALKLNNKSILIIGMIVILVALAAWGLTVRQQQLHGAPRSALSPISNIDRLKPTRFIPYCDPLREVCEKPLIKEVITEKTVKDLEFDVKKKKSYR